MLAGSENRIQEQSAISGRAPDCTILNRRDGIILAFDTGGLVALARSYDCIIEMVPQVGDFISAGQPLFHVYGKEQLPTGSSLENSVAVGPERNTAPGSRLCITHPRRYCLKRTFPCYK